MNNKFKHFLITGANGFIGRRLSQILKTAGYTVTAVLRNNPHELDNNFWDDIIFHDFNYDCYDNDCYDNDIQDDQKSFTKKHLEMLSKKHIDVIIHLANIAHTGSEIGFAKYWQSNVVSTLDLLDFANLANIKAFLYISSVNSVKAPKSSYNNKNGCEQHLHLIDESYALWPDQEDYYGISKRIAENLLLKGPIKSDMHISILRPSLVYGPKVKGNLSMLIKAAKKQLLPNLPNIKNKLSMVHVDDLIEAMLLAINSPKANKKIFIVTDNGSYSTRSICNHIKSQVTANNNKLLYLLTKITIPYIGLKIIAKFCDIIKLIISKFNKGLSDKLFFDSIKLNKLFASSNFSSRKIQETLSWRPKHTFWDCKD